MGEAEHLGRLIIIIWFTSLGPSHALDAALAFYKALKVYPQPGELISIYDKTVPKVSLPSIPYQSQTTNCF